MTFSKRHGFSSVPPIKFRQEAPEDLRFAIVQAAYEHLSYDQIRTSFCRTLSIAPDRNNWTEVPNIRDEVEWILQSVEWYRVYDAIEGLISFIENSYGCESVKSFADRINSVFEDVGAGWKIIAGEGIVVRGDAEFEEVVKDAQSSLVESNFVVAEKEIREALADLSRRPEADLTGAIHHVLGAVEATARYIHKSNGDLGSIVDKIGLPRPLDEALRKVWGFSSNFGRHVSPTKIPSLSEAQLIVHLSSAYCRFLADAHK